MDEEWNDFMFDPSDPTGDAPFKGTFDTPPAGEDKQGYRAVQRTGTTAMVHYKGLKFSAPSIHTAKTVSPWMHVLRKERPKFKNGGVTRTEIVESASRAASGAGYVEDEMCASITPWQSESAPSNTIQNTVASFFISKDEDLFPESDTTADLSAQTPSKNLREPMVFPKTGMGHSLSLRPLGRRPKTFIPINPGPKLEPPVYCICRKPEDGTKMTRCLNDYCSIVWFHYRCLSKGEKISSLYNKWTCEVCMTAKHYEKQNAGKMDLTDFKDTVPEKQILSALAVPGNTTGIQDPYGMRSVPVPSVPIPEVEGNDDENDWVEYGYEQGDLEEYDDDGFEEYEYEETWE